MNKIFEEKIKALGLLDTERYRYLYRDGIIKRLPISCLNTTDAINGWEIVKDCTKEDD